MSHRFKKNSVFFGKTMQDIHALRLYCSVSNSLPSEFELSLTEDLAFREKMTYSYSHPKLNQDKQSFFTDSVPYEYDHDSIHESVKHLDKPAYKYYIQDNAAVFCDKKKFDALPHIVKLYGVLEESYVLALERAIIIYGTAPEKAFRIAFEKVCTSITSGWFREFAWEHYDEVTQLYHSSFVDKFQHALVSGKILDYTGSKY